MQTDHVIISGCDHLSPEYVKVTIKYSNSTHKIITDKCWVSVSSYLQMRGGEVGLMHISISFKTLKAPHLYRTSLQTLGKHLELGKWQRSLQSQDLSFMSEHLDDAFTEYL